MSVWEAAPIRTRLRFWVPVIKWKTIANAQYIIEMQFTLNLVSRFTVQQCTHVCKTSNLSNFFFFFFFGNIDFVNTFHFSPDQIDYFNID